MVGFSRSEELVEANRAANDEYSLPKAEEGANDRLKVCAMSNEPRILLELHLEIRLITQGGPIEVGREVGVHYGVVDGLAVLTVASEVHDRT